MACPALPRGELYLGRRMSFKTCSRSEFRICQSKRVLEPWMFQVLSSVYNPCLLVGSKFGSVSSPFPLPMTLLSLVGSCVSVTHKLNNVILSTPNVHTKGKGRRVYSERNFVQIYALILPPLKPLTKLPLSRAAAGSDPLPTGIHRPAGGI